MNLHGKTAVITGGGRGIGRAYADRLLADGANVVVIDRDIAELGSLSGVGETMALTADFSDPEAVVGAAEAVLGRFGRCDILISNAAFMPMTTLETITSGTWRQVQAVNVEPLVHLARAFEPGMTAAGWGRIVATGSAVTLHPQTRDLAYITSKAAIHGLVKALANDLGERGITVNAIAPTVVRTPGFADRLPGGAPTADQMMDRIVSQQTIARPCRPDDVAGALAWLVSDDAGFVTG